MQTIGLLIALFFSLVGTAQKIDFDTYFRKESLRIDFFLLGTDQTAEVILYRIKKEPFYAAASSNQLMFPAFGNYKVEIKDVQTAELLFSKGFNPLFEEWQYTAEAKKTKRIFENSLQLPFPKKEVEVEISKRNKKGKFEKIYSQKIFPKDYNILSESIKTYPVKKIIGNKPSEKAIDIAIVAEGYTDKEMDKFLKDAQKMVDYIFSIKPFEAQKSHFNIYAIQSPSLESGTDVPHNEEYKNTVVDSRFYTFEEPRYLTVSSIFKVADVAANVPYDHIYVLVNSAAYGGGGFYNVLSVATADHTLSSKVFVHELGHGLIGLADEYYSSSVPAEESIYNTEIEPWEKNITTLIDFESKWQSLIAEKTPIPTPRISIYEQKVGVFQGGGYSEKGVYSPAMDCVMKSMTPKDFCTVCSNAINEVIEFYIK